MPTPPKPLTDFLDLHRRGEFWESHEVLEGPWRAHGSRFYQGLILYASAWVHWQRGNAHGVDAQLRKTLDRLADYPALYLGIDVAAVRAHAVQVRERVARGPGWEADVRPLDLEMDPGRIAGDEPELSVTEPGRLP